MGSIDPVNSPDIDGTSPVINTLDVQWRQTDPDAAKSAKYSLRRYGTGDDSTGTSYCTDVEIMESGMDQVANLTGFTDYLKLTVDVCSDYKPLSKGRWATGVGANCLGVGV